MKAVRFASEIKRAAGAAFITGLLICVCTVRASFAADNVRSNSDHLEPVNTREEGPYRSELEAKLFVTSADCGRMSVRPSWTPEFAVSIHSESSDGSKARTYHVTVTQASANIWYSMPENSESGLNQPVQVTRWDVEISASTALQIRRVWKEALQTIRKRKDAIDSPTDGEIVEFALVEPKQWALFGELPIHPGPRTRALEKIGNLLIEYCRAPLDQRSALAARIHQDAKKLSRQFRTERR